MEIDLLGDSVHPQEWASSIVTLHDGGTLQILLEFTFHVNNLNCQNVHGWR